MVAFAFKIVFFLKKKEFLFLFLNIFLKGVFSLLMIEWMLPLWYSTYQFGLDMI